MKPVEIVMIVDKSGSMQNLVNAGNFSFQLLQGRNIFSSGTNVARNASDSALFGRYAGGALTASGIVDILETQGLVTVLAEPSLTTTSGKTANFLAGGEYPVPTVDKDGAVSISYKTYGVSLNFTPTVLSRDKISLTVTPEVSTVAEVNTLQAGSSVSFPIPTLQTRRACMARPDLSWSDEDADAMDSSGSGGGGPSSGVGLRYAGFRRHERRGILCGAPARE